MCKCAITAAASLRAAQFHNSGGSSSANQWTKEINAVSSDFLKVYIRLAGKKSHAAAILRRNFSTASDICWVLGLLAVIAQYCSTNDFTPNTASWGNNGFGMGPSAAKNTILQAEHDPRNLCLIYNIFHLDRLLAWTKESSPGGN
jgi:hypothetical protein